MDARGRAKGVPQSAQCVYCASSFFDCTKNHRRTVCDSLECKRERRRFYRKNITEAVKIKQKQWRDNNKEYLKNWRDKNRERDRELNRRSQNARYNNNIFHRLKTVLRSRLYHAIKRGFKGGSAIDNLGCSIKELKSHLELQFKPGMTWDNYGEWHIDHRIPLDKFDLTDTEQVKKACNYSNLQPLWAIDNIKKSNK